MKIVSSMKERHGLFIGVLQGFLRIRLITHGLLGQQSSIKPLFGESDMRNRVEVDL